MKMCELKTTRKSAWMEAGSGDKRKLNSPPFPLTLTRSSARDPPFHEAAQRPLSRPSAPCPFRGSRLRRESALCRAGGRKGDARRLRRAGEGSENRRGHRRQRRLAL